jgi:alkyl hydroperoxide reductase 1
MSALKAGDKFPDGVTFGFIRPTPEKADITACGLPEKLDASKEFADKKVVLVSVPGAFTPTCQVDHVSGYIAKLDALKKAGADSVIFIAYNDPFVMSAWGKANGITDDRIVSAGFPPSSSTSFSISLCPLVAGVSLSLGSENDKLTRI